MAVPRGFRYDTLLRVRRRQEDLRAQALAAARREVRIAKDHRARIAAEQMRALALAGEMMEGVFDASEVRRYYQYERHLARLRDSKDAQIRQLEAKAEIRRRELEAATKSKRVMEKLKDRQDGAYRDYLRTSEQRRLDEVATVRAALGNAPWADSAAQEREQNTQ